MLYSQKLFTNCFIILQVPFVGQGQHVYWFSAKLEIQHGRHEAIFMKSAASLCALCKMQRWSLGVREVVSSNPGRGTIVRGVFHPVRKLARFSLPNMPLFKILNLFRIHVCPRGEALNYRPSASPSYEVASHVNNYDFGRSYYYYCTCASHFYLPITLQPWGVSLSILEGMICSSNQPNC
jgi:hypothetical protein